MEALLTLQELAENFETKIDNSQISNIFKSFLTKNVIHKKTFLRWKQNVNKELIENLNLNFFFETISPETEYNEFLW